MALPLPGNRPAAVTLTMPDGLTVTAPRAFEAQTAEGPARA